MIKQLKLLQNFVTNERDDLLKVTLPTIDIEGIADKLLNAKSDSDIGMPLDEALSILLNTAQYIETDTTMESIMMDDTYDKLHEKYIDLTGHSITGTNGTSGSNRPTAQHKYPELRGSIDKTHFIYDKDVPDKDSRKSLESWFRAAIKKCYPDNTKYNGIIIGSWFKWDGVSGVFEASKNTINEVLTRKDTDTNTGTVITHIFKGKKMSTIFKHNNCLPADLYNKSEYGVKTEIFMTMPNFERFKSSFVTNPPKNHRSAVSMITNTLAEDYIPEWLKYLTIQPLQISCNEELELSSDDCDLWQYVGEENGRHQYIRTENITIYTSDVRIDDILYVKSCDIECYRNAIQTDGLPIDGVVITILSPDMVSKLGRSDNKNKYQVAFKFAAGTEKTKVKNVTFPVGPVTGLITPLLEIEPVTIMGNTITNATLSNIDKFDRLNLHVGDEIFIKYNIVPTVYKTTECVESTNPKIEFPTQCPVCNHKLDVKVNEDSGNRTVRCINLDCPSRVSGKIYNYINKLGIMGIGLNTIEDLISVGIINKIPDLYRIQEYENEIINMPGYGQIKYNNIVKAINSKLTLYPHELLGSIGIPDIGRRIMKKVCKSIDFNELINLNPSMITLLVNIDGIGEKFANKICEGILNNKFLIDEILHYVAIKPYEDEPETTFKVLFSKVRDTELADILRNKYNADIQDSYTKDTSLVIIKDKTAISSKIEKARKDGKRIITIDEARKEFS